MRNPTPHFGHLVFRPSADSGAGVFAPHAGHTTGIGTDGLRSKIRMD